MLFSKTLDHEMVDACVAEFAAASGCESGGLAAHCYYESADFPGQRLVFTLVGSPLGALSLKVDFAPGQTRLRREFDHLKRLHDALGQDPRNSVVTPVYLSPGGAFHVTQLAEGKTAKEVVYASSQDAQAAQAFRRGGQWLEALHKSTVPQEAPIWLGWMTDTLSRRLEAGDSAVPAARIEAEMQRLKRELAPFQGAPHPRAFSHGDYLGGNLILGRGINIGLDFTESEEKHRVYDVVDFLKMDVMRPCPQSVIGPEGLNRSAREMFLRGYRLPLSPDLLTLCLRGRLLIDWVAITQDRLEQSAFQRRKYAAHETRLTAALALTG